MMSFDLSFFQIFCAFCYGVILSLIYLGLLWLTLKHLPHTQHKGMWLFVSAVIRLALFLYLSVLLSQHNPFTFLLIVVGFVIARLCLVGRIKSRSNT